MDWTVFLTVLSGVLTYVLGQLVVKLVIEPVQDMRKTIGLISHALIEHASIYHNPGVPTQDAMNETSRELRKLSSQLQAHLFLVPRYGVISRIFGLPLHASVLEASSALIGLSNSVFNARENIYEVNANRVAKICDSLGIYLPEGSRWPKDMK